MGTNVGRSFRHQQYPIRTKGNSRCPSHKDNDVVLLCQDCGILICITCSITEHKAHIDSFRELTHIKQDQKATLQQFVNQTENERIPKLNQEILSTQQKLSTSLPIYTNIYENIEKQRVQCQMELERVAESYKATCKQMEMATSHLLQTHTRNLEERLNKLKELSSEYKHTLQKGSVVMMYDSVMEIREMDFNSPLSPHVDITEFTPEKDRQTHLKAAMGNMKFSAEFIRALEGIEIQPNIDRNSGSQYPMSVPFKILDNPISVSQFTYKYGITSICPKSAQHAWVCNIHTNTAKLIRPKKSIFTNKFELVEEINHKNDLTDISVDPTTGMLWFCCMEEKAVYHVPSLSTPIKSFVTEDGPASICMTRDGHVVVGTWGTEGYKVVVYTTDGHVLYTAMVERSGTGVTQSITQCGVTGNIAVVSSKLISGDGSHPEDYRRHIIIFSPILQPLVLYRGEGILAQGKGKQVRDTPLTFDPYTLIYDSKGNIVIADINRNTIELINGKGTYIKTLHTNKGGQGPIGIQKDDVLWLYVLFGSGKWGLKLIKYYSH
ncbi:uncharacterized protein [Argopecten irradians]|uniref:uncharacterized protein n=1 Tax=Argopecten irradians TaxID=31199 RepID=UPI003710BFC4